MMDSLFLKVAPPYDPGWVKFEKENNLDKPQLWNTLPPIEYQPIYLKECRARNKAMMAFGARDHGLSHGITVTKLTVPSSNGRFQIPVLQFRGHHSANHSPCTSILYCHGGGLVRGEADSEELVCRRIVKESELPNITVYAVGYRLMPQNPASTCVSDCMDALNYVKSVTPHNGKLLVVGSSSGGQLAAAISQHAPAGTVHGVVLRAPVTSDAFSGMQYVPEKLRSLHTSAWEPSFWNTILGQMKREVPRDGLKLMPLEEPDSVLKKLPRHFIQLCTNDSLYSDGFCYAKALDDVGVEVKTDVIRGWPHAFWLFGPQLDRALEADRTMLKGLAWVAK